MVLVSLARKTNDIDYGICAHRVNYYCSAPWEARLQITSPYPITASRPSHLKGHSISYPPGLLGPSSIFIYLIN